MKKYKHFLALGASTLALGLSQSAYAVDNIQSATLNDQNVMSVSNDNTFNEQIKNSIKVSDSTITSNTKFMEENPSYLPEQKEIATQTNEIKADMQKTVFQAVKNGYIKFHELPTTYKINVIQGFSTVAEDSHYDATENSLQLSFIPEERVKKIQVSQSQTPSSDMSNLPEDVREAAAESMDDNTTNEMHSKGLSNEFIYGFKHETDLSKQVGSYNEKLINQLIFLHELSHSVNHHVNGEKSSDSIYVYKKTTDNLNQDETKAFSVYTSDTLDENFADAYGSIMFLKLNNFSTESINSLKQIATTRDYNAKSINKNYYNDSVEAHYSYYTLENVLNNIDKIKATNGQKNLIDLARDFSSNGTYQAYQNYGKAHNNSFNEEKQRDIAELATQYLYNSLNKDKPGFVPLQLEKEKYGNTYYSDLTQLDKEAIKNWSDNEISKYHSVFSSSEIAKALDVSNVKANDISKTFNLIKGLQLTQDAKQLQIIKDSTPYVFLKSKIVANNDFEKTNLPPIYQNIIHDIVKYEKKELYRQNNVKEVLSTISAVRSNVNSAINSSSVNTINTVNNAQLNNSNNQTYSLVELLPILDNLDKQLSTETVSTYTHPIQTTDAASNTKNSTSNLSNKIKSIREQKDAQNNEAIQTQHTSTVNGTEGNYKISIKDKRKSLGFSNETDEQKNKENIAQTLRASFMN